MIEILIALIAVTALSVYGARECRYSTFGYACFAVGLIGFAGLIIYCFIAFYWFGAEYKKDIINREYGTEYTQAEIFYASKVIDTIRELDRSRVEVSGDLMRDDK